MSYYVTDVRGSVVAIVDENGNITHKYQYDEFGKVTQKEETDYNPFQYVGKYGVMYLNDHQYYMRARHYDPTIGRFLSEDPIWSTNLYPYADNNPVMGIDPAGLATIRYRRLKDDNGNFDDSALGKTAYYLTTKTSLGVIFDLKDHQYIHAQIFFDGEEPFIIPGYNNDEPIRNIGYGAPINDSEEGYYIVQYLPEEETRRAVEALLPNYFGEYDYLNNNCQTYVDTISKMAGNTNILNYFTRSQNIGTYIGDKLDSMWDAVLGPLFKK